MIGKSLGQSVRVLRTPGSVALWSGAAVSEAVSRLHGRPFILNFDKVREARAGNWVCSTQTIRRDLGFRPQWSFAERLHQTANWYRQQHWS